MSVFCFSSNLTICMNSVWSLWSRKLSKKSGFTMSFTNLQRTKIYINKRERQRVSKSIYSILFVSVFLYFWSNWCSSKVTSSRSTFLPLFLIMWHILMIFPRHDSTFFWFSINSLSRFIMRMRYSLFTIKRLCNYNYPPWIKWTLFTKFKFILF